MIAFIKGTVEYMNENSIILENNNIGYNIKVPSSAINKLSLKEEVRIYTYMNITQDNGIDLYGFLTREEIKMFNMLTSVSGVGPKAGLSILSVMTVNDINLSLIGEDSNRFAKAPGIGKKTAQRIILELKDKVKTEDALPQGFGNNIPTGDFLGGQRQEAIDGLCALGFSKNEAIKAISTFNTDDLTSSQIIKQALKSFSG